MEKVKLPREVSEALDIALYKLDWEPQNILVKTARRDWESEELQILNRAMCNDSFILLIAQAVINGYEAEQTPEDKVRDQYMRPVSFVNKDHDTDADIYRKGIKFALDTLGIKIEGVNA